MTAARRAGQSLSHLHQWAVGVRDQCGFNEATVAVANKLARIDHPEFPGCSMSWEPPYGAWRPIPEVKKTGSRFSLNG